MCKLQSILLRKIAFILCILSVSFSSGWAETDVKRVEKLIEQLKAKDPTVTEAAILSLGNMGEAAVTPLIKTLQDKNPNIRENVVRALGKVKSTKATTTLIQSLKDPNLWVRKRAAWSLGEINDRRAVAPLISTFLNDKDQFVREVAATVLGNIGDTKAIPYLINALENDEMRPKVIEALEQFNDPTAKKAISTYKNYEIK